MRALLTGGGGDRACRVAAAAASPRLLIRSSSHAPARPLALRARPLFFAPARSLFAPDRASSRPPAPLRQVILFEDYNVEELLQIATGFLQKQHLSMTSGALEALTAKLTAMVTAKDVQNGNGRAVRHGRGGGGGGTAAAFGRRKWLGWARVGRSGGRR